MFMSHFPIAIGIYIYLRRLRDVPYADLFHRRRFERIDINFVHLVGENSPTYNYKS